MPNFSESSEQLLPRKAVAMRWSCSTETIKRRTREGWLHPVRFNQRLIRYPLSEIIRIEQEASGRAPFSKSTLSPLVGFRPSQTDGRAAK